MPAAAFTSEASGVEAKRSVGPTACNPRGLLSNQTMIAVSANRHGHGVRRSRTRGGDEQRRPASSAAGADRAESIHAEEGLASQVLDPGERLVARLERGEEAVPGRGHALARVE